MPAASPSSDPALALLELSSIGRGARVLDAVSKRAPVTVRIAEPVSSGKYLFVFTGEVAAVEESLAEGKALGGATVINQMILPQVHPDVVAALGRRIEVPDVDALAIVEMLSLATTVAAADVAAKTADVRVIEIRLGHGIGGKGYFTLTGPHADLEAAVAAAKARAEQDGFLVGVELIPRPHADLVANLTGRR